MEVGLSAILDLFDSNQFMLCPQATSFFQSLCSAPPLLFHIYQTVCVCLCIYIYVCATFVQFLH